MKKLLANIPINRYLDVFVFVILLIFPFVQKTYWIYVMSGIMAYMMFALSLDLLWGYTGLMSMGHSLLFGAGGYIVGIACAYANHADWIEFDKLPYLLAPLSSNVMALIMAIIVPGIISLIIGLFMFTGKIQGVFFSLITMALSGVAELFVINQSQYTHGNSGISIVARTILSNDPADKVSDFTFYFIVLCFLVITYLICLLITSSRIGKVLQSIRENEARLTFFGYKPYAFKLLIYVISGMIAGFSGVLYVRTQGTINSTAVGINLSTMVLVWIAVGGRGNLTGAMVGTLVLQVVQTALNSVFSGISADFAQYWQLVLGVIILIIVFAIPKGIVGTMIEIQQKNRDHKRKELINNER